MAIKPELMKAILAMDSYNRGYDAGIDLRIKDGVALVDAPRGGAGALLFRLLPKMCDNGTVIATDFHAYWNNRAIFF